MKKIIGIILIIVGVVATLKGVISIFYALYNIPSNISIIGGADGPTAIFLAGRISGPIYGAIIGGIIALIIGIVLILSKKK